MAGIDVEDEHRVGRGVVGGEGRDVAAAGLADGGALVIDDDHVAGAVEVVDQIAADIGFGGLRIDDDEAGDEGVGLE